MEYRPIHCRRNLSGEDRSCPMLKSTFNLWWASLLSLFLLGATSHVTQSQQVHDLTFGKTIDGYASTGGEGWIQNPGEVEIFRFEVTVPGQKIFLEWGEQDPALRQLPVKLLDPWGKDLFGSLHKTNKDFLLSRFNAFKTAVNSLVFGASKLKSSKTVMAFS